MILTEDEFQPVLEPHLGAVKAWHVTAHKRRDGLRLDKADQWADQDAATQGRWVTNLVVAAARDDEAEDRQLVRLNGFDAVAINHEGRRAAHFRFRRVTIEPDQYGDPRPVITAPLRPIAEDWFGNRHLAYGKQASFFDADPPRLHTNLLVGHTVDPVTSRLGRVVIACMLGTKVLWWRDVDAPAAATTTGIRRREGEHLSFPSVVIEPKASKR